jgi:predicted  nucleic acid-binding Zn-ribbon protein
MTDHEQRAEQIEQEVEDLERQSKRLGDEISDTREDWERKQTDSSVPGAVGEPASASELPPPEPDETD